MFDTASHNLSRKNVPVVLQQPLKLTYILREWILFLDSFEFVSTKCCWRQEREFWGLELFSFVLMLSAINIVAYAMMVRPLCKHENRVILTINGTKFSTSVGNKLNLTEKKKIGPTKHSTTAKPKLAIQVQFFLSTSLLSQHLIFWLMMVKLLLPQVPLFKTFNPLNLLKAHLWYLLLFYQYCHCGCLGLDTFGHLVFVIPAISVTGGHLCLTSAYSSCSDTSRRWAVKLFGAWGTSPMLLVQELKMCVFFLAAELKALHWVNDNNVLTDISGPVQKKISFSSSVEMAC